MNNYMCICLVFRSCTCLYPIKEVVRYEETNEPFIQRPADVGNALSLLSAPAQAADTDTVTIAIKEPNAEITIPVEGEHPDLTIEPSGPDKDSVPYAYQYRS